MRRCAGHSRKASNRVMTGWWPNWARHRGRGQAMDGDQAMSSLWYVLALVLVGSALLARRAPTGGLLRMAVLWIVIFAILLGLFKAGEIGRASCRERVCQYV